MNKPYFCRTFFSRSFTLNALWKYNRNIFDLFKSTSMNFVKLTSPEMILDFKVFEAF